MTSDRLEPLWWALDVLGNVAIGFVLVRCFLVAYLLIASAL